MQAAQLLVRQNSGEAAHGPARGLGAPGAHQDVEGPMGRRALGRVGDDDGAQLLAQRVELVAHDIDDGDILGPGSGGDDVQRRAAGANARVRQMQSEAAQHHAHILPIGTAGGIGQKAVKGVAGQKLQLLGGIEGVELGQERDEAHAERSGGVVVGAAQEGTGARGQGRIVVEAGDEGPHEGRIGRDGRLGGQVGSENTQEVVDAVGGEQVLGDAVAQLGPGGGEEGGLLGCGQGEPGQGPVGGEVTGAHDGGDGDLSVDVAQQGVVAPPGAVLAAGLGGRQADERGRGAGGDQTTPQIVDDDGPVSAQVVAFVQDDRRHPGVDEGVQAFARPAGQ